MDGWVLIDFYYLMNEGEMVVMFDQVEVSLGWVVIVDDMELLIWVLYCIGCYILVVIYSNVLVVWDQVGYQMVILYEVYLLVLILMMVMMVLCID